jgi:hypothetical protein
MSNTVHVEGIASQTTEKEVRDFFSFWYSFKGNAKRIWSWSNNQCSGKIANLSVTPTSDDEKATKSATVTFEKETAAKTALLLDNTQLGPGQVTVKSAASLTDIAGEPKVEEHDEHHVPQEDKPRSRILAEYLAHGLVKVLLP